MGVVVRSRVCSYFWIITFSLHAERNTEVEYHFRTERGGSKLGRRRSGAKAGGGGKTSGSCERATCNEASNKKAPPVPVSQGGGRQAASQTPIVKMPLVKMPSKRKARTMPVGRGGVRQAVSQCSVKQTDVSEGRQVFETMQQFRREMERMRYEKEKLLQKKES